jgi:hypothetical protein
LALKPRLADTLDRQSEPNIMGKLKRLVEWLVEEAIDCEGSARDELPLQLGSLEDAARIAMADYSGCAG